MIYTLCFYSGAGASDTQKVYRVSALRAGNALAVQVKVPSVVSSSMQPHLELELSDELLVDKFLRVDLLIGSRYVVF
jgi:hypothetical protein